MNVGVFAKTFPGTDPAAVLLAAKAAGFDAVQWNMACAGLPTLPPRIDAATVAAVRDGAAAAGVRIPAISATFNIIHPDRDAAERGFAGLAVLAGAAQAMGCDLLTLCTGTCDAADMWRGHPDNATPSAWAAMRAAVDRALEIAEAHGIRLGVEPEHANVVNDARAAARLLREAGSDRLVIVFDPANLLTAATLPDQHAILARAADLLGARTAILHAKDMASDGTLQAAGRGAVDFAHARRRLAAQGFSGPVIAHGLTAAEAPGAAAHLRRLT